MWIPHGNTDLVVEFIKKLVQETRNNRLKWTLDGGVLVELNPKYLELGLIEEQDGEKFPIYHPQHMNQNIRWLLCKDIACLPGFTGFKDLVVIPFTQDKPDGSMVLYDCIYVWKSKNGWRWEKVFFSGDDPTFSIKKEMDKLYELIEASEYDADLSAQVFQMMTDFVKGDRA